MPTTFLDVAKRPIAKPKAARPSRRRTTASAVPARLQAFPGQATRPGHGSLTPFRVGLIVDTASDFGRGVIAGIIRYIRSHGGWNILGDPRLASPLLEDLAAWKGDGLIIQSYTPGFQDLVRAAGLAAVNVSGFTEPGDMPTVTIDNEAVGRMAADDLLRRGFRSLAFVGPSEFWYSRSREDAFRRRIIESGGRVDYQTRNVGNRIPADKGFVPWLRGLPTPVGILCANDYLGLQVLDACAEAERAVPEQAAVLGVDNEPLLCELGNPPLSSVTLNPSRIGYSAAEMLDRLMHGGPRPLKPVLIPPASIAHRRSSDIVALADPVIAAALAYIQATIHRRLRVDEICQYVGVGRRTLEIRFIKALHRTPQVEIRRQKLLRIKELLTETNLSMLEVAQATGVIDARQLALLFRRETGLTLSGYRRAGRGQDSKR